MIKKSSNEPKPVCLTHKQVLVYLNYFIIFDHYNLFAKLYEYVKFQYARHSLALYVENVQNVVYNKNCKQQKKGNFKRHFSKHWKPNRH